MTGSPPSPSGRASGATSRWRDLAEALPPPEDGGLTYVFHLRRGIRFSNGQEVGVHDVGGVVPAHLQGQFAHRGRLLRRHRRRRRLPEGRGALHAGRRRGRRRGGGHGHLPPRPSGRRVPRQAVVPARLRAAGRHAGARSRQRRAARHRSVSNHQLRPEPRAARGIATPCSGCGRRKRSPTVIRTASPIPSGFPTRRRSPRPRTATSTTCTTTCRSTATASSATGSPTRCTSTGCSAPTTCR